MVQNKTEGFNEHRSLNIIYNVSVKHNEIYYYIRVFWAKCFDSYRVIFRRFKNYIHDKMSLKMQCGFPNALGIPHCILSSFYLGS